MTVPRPVLDLAQLLLLQARRDEERARRRRIKAMHVSRSLGLSHQQIGTPLGISEAGVRGMLQRHPET